MMNFRSIKSAIVTLLGSAAAGRYRTIDFKADKTGAGGVVNSDRSVQVYNTSGDFPQNAGSPSGPVMHDVVVKIELMASAKAQGDLATLSDATASEADRAIALTAFQDATLVADDSIDELINIIYQILMDAENLDLGYDDPISDRWVPSWNKADPIQEGELVTFLASMNLTYRIDEQLTGATPTPATPDEAVDTNIEITQDDEDDMQDGAAVKNGG